MIRVHRENFWSMKDIMYFSYFPLYRGLQTCTNYFFFPTKSSLTVKSRVSFQEGHWDLLRPSVGNMQGWVDILIQGMDMIIYTWHSNSLSSSVKSYTYCFRTTVEWTLISIQKELKDTYVCMFQKCFLLYMETQQLHPLHWESDAQGTEYNAPKPPWCTEKRART